MALAEASVSARKNTLFVTCFTALVATAFCFVLRAFVIDDWGHEYNLSATQKGELLGVGLWPFSISIVLLSLLIDRVGFRAVLWFAVACHLIGTAVTLTAAGYWSLYIGTFVLALGNGAVEAAINPLIATAYRHDKTKWLNMLHAGWPGGLVLGGLLALSVGGDINWRWKIGLVIVPVVIYSLMLLRERFPVSERVAAGVSYREMLAEAGYISALIVASLIVVEIGRVFEWPLMLQVILIAALTAAYAFYAKSPGRLLFIIMLLIMVPLATTELGTDSWITSLLEPEMVGLGLQPGWVLVYTSALMLVLRLFAGPLVHRFSPLGLLAICSVIAAIGLYSLSVATGAALLLAATLYGVGKSFFWPTSIGFVAEQFPKGGAVTMNVVAGVGMLAVGIVGSVLLGSIQDRAIGQSLAAYDAQHSTQLHATFFTNEKTGVFGRYRALDEAKVAGSDEQTRTVVNSVVTGSKKIALKSVAVLPLIMLGAYILLMLYFRKRGGYRAVVLPSIAVLVMGCVLMSPSAQAAGEWKPLFNGKDLEGWKQVGPGRFVVENGVLKTEGGMGLLWYTREKFADSTLRIVYSAPKPKDGGNSGVFIRIPMEPTEPWGPVNKGYEVQIDEAADDFHRTGVLYSFTKARAKPEAREWNTMEITLDGDRTVVVVNGATVTDFREGDPVPKKEKQYEPDRGKRAKDGFIGLQNHNDKDVVLFREISVKKNT